MIGLVWCGECGEQIDAASECESLGVDADEPRCRFCCRCTDCAADLSAALHGFSIEGGVSDERD